MPGSDAVLADDLNRLSESIIGAAIAVHREIGPGLLESVYEACLAHELKARGFRVERQRYLDLSYKGLHVPEAFRVDLVVEDGSAVVFVELKAIEKLLAVHEAQLVTHLKLGGCHLGLLINFNVDRLTDGVRRRVNRFPR